MVRGFSPDAAVVFYVPTSPVPEWLPEAEINRIPVYPVLLNDEKMHFPTSSVLRPPIRDLNDIAGVILSLEAKEKMRHNFQQMEARIEQFEAKSVEAEAAPEEAPIEDTDEPLLLYWESMLVWLPLAIPQVAYVLGAVPSPVARVLNLALLLSIGWLWYRMSTEGATEVREGAYQNLMLSALFVSVITAYTIFNPLEDNQILIAQLLWIASAVGWGMTSPDGVGIPVPTAYNVAGVVMIFLNAPGFLLIASELGWVYAVVGVIAFVISTAATGALIVRLHPAIRYVLLLLVYGVLMWIYLFGGWDYLLNQ
jgi:hypothetical protein